MAKKIKFWNGQYEFDAEKFREDIDNAIEEAQPKWDTDGPHNEEEFELPSITEEEAEEANLEGYYSIIIPPSKSKEICEKRLKLYTLTAKKQIKRKDLKQIKILWKELEQENSLIFPTPRLRKYAERKLKLTEYTTFDYFLSGGSLSCDKNLLIEYLKSDLSLLQSEPVIRYLRYLKENEKGKVLKKILAEALTKHESGRGLEQRSQKDSRKRYVLDWVFAQIYYMKNIANLGLNQSDLYTLISDKYNSCIEEKSKGIPGSPKASTIESYYKSRNKIYKSELTEEKITEIIKKSVNPIY